MPKDKKPKRTCLCGCGSTNSATKAAHKRTSDRPVLRRTLELARSIAQIRPNDQTTPPTPGPSRTEGSSRSRQSRSTNLTVLGDTSEGEVPGHADSGYLSADPQPDLLAHVWANRESRVERQDEDLFSRPPSPLPDLIGLGMGQDFDDDEAQLSDFSTENEEEPRTSARLTATQRLNTDFELQAARAGMCAFLLNANSQSLIEIQPRGS